LFPVVHLRLLSSEEIDPISRSTGDQVFVARDAGLPVAAPLSPVGGSVLLIGARRSEGAGRDGPAVAGLGVRRRAVFAPLVVGSLVLSLVPVVLLHLVSAGEVDPVSRTISDYVFVAGGAGLLAVTSLSLAGGSALLLAGLRRAGGVSRGVVSLLVGAWSAGLVVATVFPTDPSGTPTSLSGAVHRYAGAVMFTALPAAGLLLSRHFSEDRTLRRLSIASAVTAAAFFVSHVSVVLPFGGVVLLGFAERILFAVLYALLFVLARHLHRAEVAS
jgi:hypothetical protein